jgi:hypothetical protein
MRVISQVVSGPRFACRRIMSADQLQTIAYVIGPICGAILLIVCLRHLHNDVPAHERGAQSAAPTSKRLDVYSLAGQFRTQSARQAACRSQSIQGMMHRR